MHESEAIEIDRCLGCGAEVMKQERVYVFGEDRMLCFACAFERGGSYDEPHDRWDPEPVVRDLLEQEEIEEGRRPEI